MTWLSRLLAVAAVVAPAALIAPANATPYMMQYNLTGTVVTGPASWQEKPLSGYFRYNSNTAPTSPGTWFLPTATFHVDFPGGYTLNTAGGVRAQVSPTGEAITFEAQLIPSDLPVPNCCGGALDMFFESYVDGTFSASTLPTTVPPGDKSLWITSDSFHLGTDTAFGVTVPEPATVAFFLAGLMALGWGMRRRELRELLGHNT